MDQAELRALEERCVQDSPPPCTAACPARVDARGVLAAVAAHRFRDAQTLLRKALPFPRAVALTCDEPCRAACVRRQRGDALRLRDVERACWVEDAAPSRAGRRPPPKPQKVAVVGGGLCGLSAAAELARKGYRVTLFERGARLGGRVRKHVSPESVTVAEWEGLERELASVIPAGVTVHLETSVAGAGVRDMRESYAAVVLAPGQSDPEGTRAAVGVGAAAEAPAAVVDLATLATPCEGVFVGGSAIRAAWSSVRSVADGCRMAISVERFLQRASLSAGREDLLVQHSRLPLDLEGIDPLAAAAPVDSRTGYSAVEAAREAARCLQCQCLQCVKACTFLRHYGSYPGKYVRQINNSLILAPGMGYRASKSMINSCALCGLCAEVCPTSIDVGEVCLDARRTMVAKGYMPPAVHHFALCDMEAANGPAFALARHQPGLDASSWAFLPGCQLPASHPSEVRAAYEHLADSLEGGVGFLLACCGAPAQWAGREDGAAQALAQVRAAWEDLGKPRLITACSSCQRLLTERLEDIPTVSLWEVLHEAGIPERSRPPLRLALHDPCAARHTPAVQAAVRQLLELTAGGHVELARSGVTTECCGYGGLQAVVNPELSREVVARRVAQDEHDYVVYCAMCRDLFVRAGKPTWHLIELIFGAPDGASPTRLGPRLTERQRTRAAFKREMLAALWGETGDRRDQEETEMRLLLTEELRDKLAERLISEDDLAAVIERAERTGERLIDPESGHLIAHARPRIITYWVEYSPAGEEGFVVHNAYSHRLQIREGEPPAAEGGEP